jgi:hypothetical protein
MKVEKKQLKFLNRLEKAQPGDVVDIIHFKRKDFKKEVANPNLGFGYDDLRGGPKYFYRWLICENYDIRTKPAFEGNGDFGIIITMTKPNTIQ